MNRDNLQVRLYPETYGTRFPVPGKSFILQLRSVHKSPHIMLNDYLLAMIIHMIFALVPTFCDTETFAGSK